MAKRKTVVTVRKKPALKLDQFLVGDCLTGMRSLPAKCVDLTIGSPPYAKKGERYGTKEKWEPEPWAEWMYQVTIAALQVTRNVVVWIINGTVEDGRYHPACELLVVKAYQAGLRCERPVIWHKNAPPSKRPWFGNDWEFCVAFRPEDSTEYFDWEAIATQPKYTSGGQFRQRTKNGTRRLGNQYPQSKLTRPRDVLFVPEEEKPEQATPGLVRATVGGGHMGWKDAHLNEAPFPEKLIEPFVKTCTAKGGVVLDPFSGSGTVPAVAARLGRHYLAFDSRADQIKLGRRRLSEVQIV